MTEAEREKLIDAMCLAYRLGVRPLRVAMGRALAVAEPVVRADEREACIVNARTALDRFGAWNGSITPDKLMKPIEKRIRARGDA